MRYGKYGRNCHRTAPRSIANWDAPLQFILLPNGSGRGQILIVGGEFTAGDSGRLRDFLRTAGPISEVQFDSGGGNAAEGPEVGRVIRKAGLSTRVATGFACISSCSMAFLGGVVRKVDNDSIYGIHTFFDKKLLDRVAARGSPDAQRNYLHQNEQGNAILAGNIQLYGQEMGISRSFFTEVMFTQRSEIFVSDELLGKLRTILQVGLTREQARTVVDRLKAEGVLSNATQVGVDEINDLYEWMPVAHSQEEVDQKLASILSNDFQCLPGSSLDYYNITNVVRR